MTGMGTCVSICVDVSVATLFGFADHDSGDAAMVVPASVSRMLFRGWLFRLGMVRVRACRFTGIGMCGILRGCVIRTGRVSGM